MATSRANPMQPLRHWRLVLHLLLGTRRFGVNDRRSSSFESMFQRPFFGFGYGVLLAPWKWPALFRILKLRMEIVGWKRP